MRRIRFHDLRHSCASLLYAHGVSLKEIQEWLGHSNISTTANIYTHLSFDSKVFSANAILDVFPGASLTEKTKKPTNCVNSAKRKRTKKSPNPHEYWAWRDSTLVRMFITTNSGTRIR